MRYSLTRCLYSAVQFTAGIFVWCGGFVFGIFGHLVRKERELSGKVQKSGM